MPYNINNHTINMPPQVTDTAASSISSNLADIVTQSGVTTIPIDWNSATYSWIASNSFSDFDLNVNKAISKLPIILKIKEATKTKDKLSIKYKIFLDKYLPETGTLYLPKLDLYCIFNTKDDKYWYRNLELTCNSDELRNKDIKLLKNTFCILVNDFNLGLDNTEVINLCNPYKYKCYAHEVLENILLDNDITSAFPKSSKMETHSKLEKKLDDLHD